MFYRSVSLALAMTAGSLSCVPLALAAESDVEAIVTANRIPTPIDKVIGSVTVITREEIDALHPESVQDLLRARGGIDMTTSGGQGKLTSLFMRGTTSQQVLVF